MNDIQAASAGALRPDAPLISDISHLGGRGALYLLALVQAHQLRQHVAPTPEATASLLSVLDALGVVRAEHHPTPASNATFPGKLPWSYTWSHVPFDGLGDRLANYLSSTGRNTLYADTWLRVWQELLSAEVIAYLQYQLRLHQFSDAFLAELITLLAPNESRYSLGHWRYACWASVRSMASVSLQHPGNEELLKFTLRTELPRRLLYALESPGEKLCFSPSYSVPACALSTTFSSIATDLGDNFWKSPPTLQHLKAA
ncbi:hypothetical protein [Pseudoxanthomonas mexicana]|uniref:hypothetical protein n=1 Tax=Pseudoxanthomonas mexicana TaxID=128785 RepID=UPI0028A62A66|nr:hypothetical protein [Pseudoxanthomonas mexicana]MCR6627670.1 hypothetical protein [Pseudoxanthomonas sp.]